MTIFTFSWKFLFSNPHFSSPDSHFKLQNHFTALFWTILHLPRLSLTQSKTPKRIWKIHDRPTKLIQNGLGRVIGRSLGGSWDVFGWLLVLGWCLGRSGWVSGSIFGGFGEAKWSHFWFKFEEKASKNPDVILVSILHWLLIVFGSLDLDFVWGFYIWSSH